MYLCCTVNKISKENWTADYFKQNPVISQSDLNSILNDAIHTNIRDADLSLTLIIGGFAGALFDAGSTGIKSATLSAHVEDGVIIANEDAGFTGVAYWNGDATFRIGVYDFDIPW